jgi:hypothetical protein
VFNLILAATPVSKKTILKSAQSAKSKIDTGLSKKPKKEHVQTVLVDDGDESKMSTQWQKAKVSGFNAT